MCGMMVATQSRQQPSSPSSLQGGLRAVKQMGTILPRQAGIKRTDCVGGVTAAAAAVCKSAPCRLHRKWRQHLLCSGRRLRAWSQREATPGPHPFARLALCCARN